MEKVITITQLHRTVASLINAVELEAATFLITRLGRVVARLSPAASPVPDPVAQRGTGSDPDSHPIEVTIPDVRFTPLMLSLFQEIAAAHPKPWIREPRADEGVVEFMRAISGLEFSGAINTAPGSCRSVLTAGGSALARAIEGGLVVPTMQGPGEEGAAEGEGEGAEGEAEGDPVVV